MKSVIFALLLLPSIAWAAGSQPVLTGVEKPVVVKAGYQTDPAISGQYVVFTDLSNRNADVWYADLTDNSLHAIATGPGDQLLPDVSGSRIVYTDTSSGAGDILLYDISTGTTTALTNDSTGQSNPAVSSRLIAWEEFGVADRHIVVRDVVLGTTTTMTGGVDQGFPSASGAKVVYINNDGVTSAVDVYDADTLVTSQIYAGPAANATIDGTHVAIALFNAIDGDIAVFDTSGVRLATLSLAGDQGNPHISGEWVSFEDFSMGAAHVGLWHWTTGDVYFPTPLTSRQQLNAISGNRMVYTDDRSGDLDIYVYEFTVTSADSTPPVLSVPADIVVNATSPAGATVNFVVTATDDVDPHPAITCDRLSGSTYPIGSNTVRCTATDASGNSSSKSFLIVVRGAADQIGDLASLVNGFNLKQGIENSLDAKLQNANAALAAANAGDIAGACNLMAAFINEVNAQSGKALTSAQASQLLAAANQVRSVLGC